MVCPKTLATIVKQKFWGGSLGHSSCALGAPLGSTTWGTIWAKFGTPHHPELTPFNLTPRMRMLPHMCTHALLRMLHATPRMLHVTPHGPTCGPKWHHKRRCHGPRCGPTAQHAGPNGPMATACWLFVQTLFDLGNILKHIWNHFTDAKSNCNYILCCFFFTRNTTLRCGRMFRMRIARGHRPL